MLIEVKHILPNFSIGLKSIFHWNWGTSEKSIDFVSLSSLARQ